LRDGQAPAFIDFDRAFLAQDGQRFTSDVLQNPPGFACIDGLFSFRPDVSNERGLAVMRVGSGGATPAAGSSRSFAVQFSSYRPSSQAADRLQFLRAAK